MGILSQPKPGETEKEREQRIERHFERVREEEKKLLEARKRVRRDTKTNRYLRC